MGNELRKILEGIFGGPFEGFSIRMVEDGLSKLEIFSYRDYKRWLINTRSIPYCPDLRKGVDNLFIDYSAGNPIFFKAGGSLFDESAIIDLLGSTVLLLDHQESY